MDGFIPAWAGKPDLGRLAVANERVHPRVGGETVAAAKSGVPVYGSSPRGRGNRPQAWDGLLRLGSSPRGRGNPDDLRNGTGGGGFIPAWAGKPFRCPWTRFRRGFIPAWAGKPLSTWSTMPA